MNTTVLGGSGFVGRHLAAHLRAQGHGCWVPQRGDPAVFEQPLGTIFYCIGLTANFRGRPLDTVDAHVGVLRQLLERASFDQLVYLSSTRVYDGAESTDEEQALRVRPGDADQVYNLSKLMGENLALSSGKPCRVVRLSNVLGEDMGPVNFVGAVVQEALQTGVVHFRTARQSSKDYLWIDDAVSGLVGAAFQGKQAIYNLACGRNMSHGELADGLAGLGIAVTEAADAPTMGFPAIATQRLCGDTLFSPRPVGPRLFDWLARVLPARALAQGGRR